LHWLTVLLILTAYATMELRDLFPKGSDARANMKLVHYAIGLSMWLMIAARLLAIFWSEIPPITPTPPLWQTRAAKAMKLALYAFMLFMPWLGWLTLSAQGKEVVIAGMNLPFLIAANKGTAEWLKEIHEAGATLGYFLIAVHAGAALFHHHFMRDDTLMRMLPKWMAGRSVVR
jgi:superoxide oxidase